MQTDDTIDFDYHISGIDRIGHIHGIRTLAEMFASKEAFGFGPKMETMLSDTYEQSYEQQKQMLAKKLAKYTNDKNDMNDDDNSDDNCRIVCVAGANVEDEIDSFCPIMGNKGIQLVNLELLDPYNEVTHYIEYREWNELLLAFHYRHFVL